MDGPLFHADVDLLDSAAEGIRASTAEQARAPLGRMANRAADYGHAELHRSMERFCGRWNDGLDLLLEDTRTIAELLERAADTYRSVDRGSAATLTADPARPVVDE